MSRVFLGGVVLRGGCGMGLYVRACVEFSAAHRIAGHPRCGRVHGHNYLVCVWVEEAEPMEVDLDFLEEWLHRNVFERFDHRFLNELLGLETVTSEDIARLVAEGLDGVFPGRVRRVEVCETERLCAGYEPAKSG